MSSQPSLSRSKVGSHDGQCAIQAQRMRFVSECSVVIITVQAIRRALAWGKSFQPRAIHQKDVGPSIVVVVKDCNAGPRCLDDVFLGVESAEDILSRQSGLRGHVDKVGDWSRWSGFCLCDAFPYENERASQEENDSPRKRECR